MPRNGRGGRRKGQPGKQYPNRADMRGVQPVKVTTGQEYGMRAQQEAAQQAMPLPQVSRVAAAPAPQPSGPLPGSLTPLDAPTARPNEPVTAGLPMGPGPGPEVLTRTGNPDDPMGYLRTLYRVFPQEEIRQLLEEAESDPVKRRMPPAS